MKRGLLSCAITVLSVMLCLNGFGQTAGPNYAGTTGNIDTGGAEWTNTDNIKTDDTNVSSAAVAKNKDSDYLVGTNFGFSIPSTATIVGIAVEIDRYAADIGMQDIALYLTKSGNTVIGNNLANTGVNWSTSAASVSYGSSSNLWGTTWTAAEINSTNFGLMLSLDNTSSSTMSASVNYIRITVSYTCDAPTSVTATASSTSLCAGETLTLTGSATDATTWSWTGPNGYTSSSQSPTITSVTSSNAGVYSLVASNSCGSATGVSTSSVTVNSAPSTPGSITSNSPQCAGTGVTFTKGSCPGGSTCYWVSSATGTETANSAATYTTATTAGTYDVWVRAYDGSCWSSAVTSSGVVNSAAISAPTIAAETSVTSSSFDANWAASAGATGYYLDVSTVNTFASFVTGYQNLNVGNVTTYSVTGLSPSTTYYYRVRAYQSCATSTNSGTETAPTTALSYCTPAPSSVDGTGITRVVMGIIDNTTGAEASNFGDYSAQVANVTQGTTVNVNITYSTGYTYFTKIWVDWNNDGDFDDTGEEVYSGESLATDPTTLAASFSVPLTATTGNHRVRIGGCDSSTPIPCYTGTYGSYEDYTINVQLAPACSGTPTAGTAGTTPQTVCSGLTASMVVTGYSSNSGLTFQWQQSADGSSGWANVSGGIGGTSTSYTTSALSITTYFRCAVTCTNSSITSYTGNVVVNVSGSSLPWSEPFNTFVPNCWAETDGTLASPSTLTGNTSVWQEDGFANSGSTGSAKINIYGTTCNDWLISPSIDLGDGSTNYQLEFDLSLTDFGTTNSPDLTGTDDKFAVIISTDNGATWTSANTLRLWDNSGSPYVYNDISYTGEDVVIDLSAYSGVVKFGFYGESLISNADNDLFIDNVAVNVIPSCAIPISAAATSITSSGATANWSVGTNAYIVEYGLSGFTPGTGATAGAGGTVINVSAGTFSTAITGLSSNTAYDYYIRQVCPGPDYSPNSTVRSFTTTCVAYTVPYFEGFESGYTNGNTIAGCLLQESVLGSATWMANSTNTTYNRTPRTGSFNATLYYSNDDWIFIPISLTSGADYEVTLYARQDYEPSTYADITIKYGTTASAAGMTNTIVAETGITNGAYQEISGYFSPSSTGVFYVGILGSINGTPYYISMDDISIDIAPTCVEPTNLAYSNVTTSTVDVTWTASISSPTNGYDFYYNTSATSPTGSSTPDLENQAGTSKTITGLNHSSTYYLWIRSDCGSGDVSNWEGPVSFNTPCGNIATFPWLEPFDTYIPNCWTEMDGTLAASSTVTTGDYNWNGDGYRNSGTTGAARINIYGTTCNDWLVTPSIDLGMDATNYQLEFDLAITDYNNSDIPESYGTDDKFVVVISTDNGATWASANILRQWSNSTTPAFSAISTSGEHVIIDLSAYSGVVQIGFYGESTTSDADNDLFIDNVAITPIQAMAYVSSTTTQNTASVAPGTTNQQVVAVTVNMLGTLSPLSITSLTFNTNGTTSAADISNATLWYSGTNSTFSATGQFGSVVAAPNGSFNFTGTQQLSSGANYFWLTYDLPTGATMGNVVDAECNSITIGSAYTPTIQAPSGSRLIAIDYCDPAPTSVDGSGITNVTFGTVNNTTGAETGNYGDYTLQSTNVNPGTTVPIYITYETGYTYNTVIWIDWNNDGDFDDTGEEVYSGVSLSDNPTTLSASFDVPSGQAEGSYTLRIGGCDMSTPTPCYTGTYGAYEDYSIYVVAPTNMAYVSSTTTQTNTSSVSPGTFTQEIIGVQIVTSGSLNPLDVSSFSFNITGTTNAADITNATLWTTGASGSFATTTQIGDLVSGPSGSFTINTGNNLPYTLSSGTNYFWLTYDVPSNATIGNFLDAVCTSITVDGTPQTPTVTDPTGNRVIDVVYCTPSYSYTCNYDYISNVTFNGINNTTTCSGSTPSNFTYYTSWNPSCTVGDSYALSVTTDGDTEGVTVWIDFNHDGLFTSNEIVLTGYSGAEPATYSTTVTIPGTAVAGSTRMRVRCGYYAAPTDPCAIINYGETEDYQITIVAGCTSPTVSAISESQTVCSGNTPGTDFSLTVSGGQTPGSYTYQWYKNGTLVVGATSATYNPGATTAQTSVYCLVQSVGCTINTQSPTAYVFVDVPFVNAEVSANAACNGAEINLIGTPTGMSSYSWTGPAGCTYSPNATSQSPTVTIGSISGSFTLTVESSNGCTASATTDIVTVTAGTPACASTPSPADNAVDVALSSTITWGAVANATSYDVYFGIGSIPTTPTTNVSTNSYTPTLAENTTYFWKIVPRNGCGAAVGCTTEWDFTTVVSTCVGSGTAIDPTGDGGFETGTTLSANSWYATTTSTTTSTQFVCNTGATGYTGARCAYVTNNTTGTPPPNTYEMNRIRVTHLYRDFEIPAGATNIKLDFKFKGAGEANKDYMKVWLVPSYYEPSYGAQITATGTEPYGRIQIGNATYSGQTTWNIITGVSIANSYAGLNSVRIVFEWTNNDNSSGTNPPAAIDDVSITYTCPLPSCSLSGITFSGTGNLPALDPELNDGILYIDVCQNDILDITPLPNTYDYDWVINAYDGNGQERFTTSTLVYPVLQASGYDGFLIVDGGATCYSWHPIRIRSSAGPTYVPVTLTFNGCAGNGEEVALGSEVTNQVMVDPFAGAINSELGDDALTYIPDGPYCDFCYESEVTFTDFPVGSTIETVEDILFLRVKMEHSNIRDIQIKLKGPNECGEAIILQDYLTFSNSPWAKDDDTYYYPYPMADQVAFGKPYLKDLETSGQPCNPNAALNYQGDGWEYCWSWNNDYDYASGYVYSAANHQPIDTPFIEYIVKPSNYQAGTNFYHPFETYDDLVGCPLNGTWAVQVCDSKERDNGWIVDWHLGLSVEHVDNFWSYDVNLDYVDWTGITCVTPTIISEQTNPLIYELTPNMNSAGDCTGTFTIYDEYGCSVTSPATTFGVTPLPTVTGIQNGDYIWAGLSSNSEWTSSSDIEDNWYYWTGAAFDIASTLPSTQNVHVVDFCSNSNPTINNNAKCNNLNIWSGKQLSMNAVNLEVTGNWDNQGTFIPGTGTVIFNGSSAQTINTSSPTGETFYNFTSHTAGTSITFNQDALITNTLTMTRGNILTGANTISLGTNTSNLGTLSHLDGTIVGNFRRWFAATTVPDVLFPVGTESAYRPAYLSYTSAPTTGGTLTASFNDSDPGSNGLTLTDGSDDIVIAAPEGYWPINANDGLSGGSYNLDLHPNGFGIIDFNKLHIIKRADAASPWVLDGTHVAATGTNEEPVMHRTGMTGFSEFGVGGEINSLPIELLSFSANCINNQAIIIWQSLSEINNAYFILEKSNDMFNFIEIARINGTGNSSNISNYKFIDKSLFNGNNYYRLKQVDFDGKTKTFNPISINCDNENDAKVYVYPNPFKSELNFNFENLDNQRIEIQIYNKVGQLVLSEITYTQGPLYSTSISLKHLEPSLYNIRIITEFKVYNIKTVKQ